NWVAQTRCPPPFTVAWSRMFTRAPPQATKPHPNTPLHRHVVSFVHPSATAGPPGPTPTPPSPFSPKRPIKRDERPEGRSSNSLARAAYQRYHRPPLVPRNRNPRAHRIRPTIRMIQRMFPKPDTSPPPPKMSSSRTKTIKAATISVVHLLVLIGGD